MDANKIKAGMTGEARVTVSEANTAKAMGSGSLEVFATPALLALMEKAACAAISGALESGQSSVGSFASLDHVVASVPGAEVVAVAEVVGTHGRRVSFHVRAYDGGGEIGRGIHERAVVDSARFMEKSSSR
ncbi:MAG: hypothetical protein FWE09_08950 [Treponema sp.]|nr:hypothetical protein [Treponema sp.]